MPLLDTFVAITVNSSLPGEQMIEAVRFEEDGGMLRWGMSSQGRSFLQMADGLGVFVGDLHIVGYGTEGGIDTVRDLIGDRDESYVIDASFLARCLFPTLRNHQLATVAALLEVTGETIPELIGRVFEELIDTLTDKGLATIQLMLHLIDGTGSVVAQVLTVAANRLVRTERTGKGRGQKVDWREVFGVEEEEEAAGEVGEQGIVDAGEVQKIFAHGGACSRHLHGYEVRESQISMALSVAEAFNEGKFLVIEAGTGTGKSIAYLAPAIIWAVRNRTRVIVSTYTKLLQDQLITKDLPQLSSIMGVPFSYTLLKGRGNYICLNRWTAVLNRLGTSLSREERIDALLLVVWAMETQTGDIAEHRGFDPLRYSGLWNKVCSDPLFCRGSRCRSDRRCFSAYARRIAQRSHVVVINHSLLFSDLMSDHAILSEYRSMIFDEAHHLEKVATQYLGRESTLWKIVNALERLHVSPTSTGLLVSFRAAITGWRDVTKGRVFEAQILLLLQRVRDVLEKGKICFEQAGEVFATKAGERLERYILKVRFRKDDNPLREMWGTVDALERAILDLKEGMVELNEWMKDLQEGTFQTQEELAIELSGQVAEWRGIVEDFQWITRAENERYVYWAELDERRLIRLVSAPLDVSEQLTAALYPTLETAIFTSATLAVRGKFAYLIKRLGLDPDRTETCSLPSPFNYDEQAIICLPTFLPSPKKGEFVAMVGKTLEELILGVRRGTLVLFTSYGMLQRVYQMVKQQIAPEGITLLGQGVDGERSHLLDRFRAEPGSVLFGVDSFWEGIDVPGEALEMLVITRLPFAVPTEPIVEAHMEKVASEGKDPFLHYSIPEAALRFRQGFGRLIRNQTDHGVVVVLDNRVTTTAFGRVFLDVLPAPKQRFTSSGELVRGINAWFGRGLKIAK